MEEKGLIFVWKKKTFMHLLRILCSFCFFSLFSPKVGVLLAQLCVFCLSEHQVLHLYRQFFFTYEGKHQTSRKLSWRFRRQVCWHISVGHRVIYKIMSKESQKNPHYPAALALNTSPTPKWHNLRCWFFCQANLSQQKPFFFISPSI